MTKKKDKKVEERTVEDVYKNPISEFERILSSILIQEGKSQELFSQLSEVKEGVNYELRY